MTKLGGGSVMEGIGVLLIIAILWYVLKPLFVGLAEGIKGLFSKKGK
jgi:hypothetical protein